MVSQTHNEGFKKEELLRSGTWPRELHAEEHARRLFLLATQSASGPFERGAPSAERGRCCVSTLEGGPRRVKPTQVHFCTMT